MNVTITCGCGAAGSVGPAALAQSWRCADCGQVWQAEPGAAQRFGALAAKLRRVRLAVVLAVLAAAVATVVLALVHPSWILIGPLALGVAAFLYRPRYRRHLAAIYAELPQATMRTQP